MMKRTIALAPDSHKELVKGPLIVDGDGTWWRGKVAEGIGKFYLLRELRRRHLGTFIRGIEGAMEVKRLDDAEGMKRFYGVLVENGLGTKRELMSITSAFVDKKIIPAVDSIVFDRLSKREPVFLSSMVGTSAAISAMARHVFRRFDLVGLAVGDMLQGRESPEYVLRSLEILKPQDYQLTDGVFNEELFDEAGRLTGINMRITTAESKLDATVAMLDRHGIKLSDCTAIGNDLRDRPILLGAGRAIASPSANYEELEGIKGLIRLAA